MDDFEFNAPIKDEKEEIQAEVQSIIKNCLIVEDEAAMIKQGRTLKKHDLLYHGEFNKLSQPSQPKERTGLPPTYTQTIGKRQSQNVGVTLPD